MTVGEYTDTFHRFECMFSRFLDLLCPPVCPICGGIIDGGMPFCRNCVQKMVTPDGQFCPRCGGRRFRQRKETSDCLRCQSAKYLFRRVIALGEYETELRKIVLKMKTDKTGFLAVAAAALLTTYRGNDLQEAKPDLIVPIPMYPQRRKSRGVNSPDILAAELGRFLKIPVAKNVIRRIRKTHYQFMLSVRERAENVADAFALNPIRNCPFFRRRQSGLAGKNVLLVDDILTTGSTCNEVAGILLHCGAAAVTVVVLARAEGNSQK
ncbi:phosphoribosyltransferase [Planctomycetales bacterium]|nr:phosphoribosyltransferase [Planctomycetales bacterium]